MSGGIVHPEVARENLREWSRWLVRETVRFVRLSVLPEQIEAATAARVPINALHALGLTLAELERDIARGETLALAVLQEMRVRASLEQVERYSPAELERANALPFIAINRSDIRNALQSVVCNFDVLCEIVANGKPLEPALEVAEALRTGIIRIRELVEAADADAIMPADELAVLAFIAGLQAGAPGKAFNTTRGPFVPRAHLVSSLVGRGYLERGHPPELGYAWVRITVDGARAVAVALKGTCQW